jgi:hypothetical protein
MRRSLLTLSALSGLAACETGSPPPTPADASQRAGDALFDFLACDEIARPSTLERLRALLDEPTTDEAIALLTAPEDLASLVAMAGPQVEGTVILARNLHLAATAGHGEALLRDGWDGLACDDALTLACTAGTGTSTVACVDEAVSGLTLDFDRCTLDGRLLDGPLVFNREADGRARVGGAGFSVDEVRTIEGELLVGVGAGPALSAEDSDGVAFVDFGGPEGGLSCGERLAAERAVLEVEGTAVRLELEGTHTTTDGQVGLVTRAGHVRVADLAACACPDAGSVLQLSLDDVVGGAGPGVLEVSWSGSGSDGGCRDVAVAATTWPEGCSGFGDDCGRAAIEGTLAGLLQAFCVGG